MSDRSVRRLTLVLLVAVAAYGLARLELTSSILHFLPSDEDAELTELSLELIDSPLARRMVLSIGGEDRMWIAAELAESLRSSP